MVEQPNFDDERTLSRARPVVPLEVLDNKVKHRRRWILGGAFAVAMFLGAASALLSAYFKMRNLPDPEIQSLSVLSLPEEAPVIPTVAIVPERPKPRPRDTDRSASLRNESVPSLGLNEKEELRQIRDAILTDEWQERRARRVERRERRRSQHRDRDLSNIDEIFEGPRHP